MDTRFYTSEKIDIERLASDLENIYRLQGYQVQQIGNNEQKLVQSSTDSDHAAHFWWYTCHGGPTKMDRQGSGWCGRSRYSDAMAAGDYGRAGSAATDRHLRPGAEYSGWIDTPAAARCKDGTSTGETIDTLPGGQVSRFIVVPTTGS